MTLSVTVKRDPAIWKGCSLRSKPKSGRAQLFVRCELFLKPKSSFDASSTSATESGCRFRSSLQLDQYISDKIKANRTLVYCNWRHISSRIWRFAKPLSVSWKVQIQYVLVFIRIWSVCQWNLATSAWGWWIQSQTYHAPNLWYQFAKTFYFMH